MDLWWHLLLLHLLPLALGQISFGGDEGPPRPQGPPRPPAGRPFARPPVLEGNQIRPTFNNQRPPFNNQRPPFNNQRPPLNNQRPPFNNQRPPFNNQRPPLNNQRPPFNNQRPPFNSNQRPPSQRPPTGNEQPSSGNASGSSGQDGSTSVMTVRQTWSQEPGGYGRVAEVRVPSGGARGSLPVVVDLHGNGGQGSVRRLSYLGDDAVIVAPSGYERSWNIYNEKSKADDVSFILELIRRVGEETSVANTSDVTIVGTSNGAAMIYRLLLETGRERPFHRVVPMVSSLISVQHHDGQFWRSTSGTATDHSIAVVPQFSPKFEYAHFHGTEDGALAYLGASPGPAFLGQGVDVLPAQTTDFLFAQAMGHSGGQVGDGEGEVQGSLQTYSYLGGRARHVKVVGGSHGSVFGNSQVRSEVRRMVTGKQ